LGAKTYDADIVADCAALLGPGEGDSGSSGSPDTVVRGAVLPQAAVGAIEGTVSARTPSVASVASNRRADSDLRSLFISSSNFPAGEGSGRGRPAAIPWPGARVSNTDMGDP